MSKQLVVLPLLLSGIASADALGFNLRAFSDVCMLVSVNTPDDDPVLADRLERNLRIRAVELRLPVRAEGECDWNSDLFLHFAADRSLAGDVARYELQAIANLDTERGRLAVVSVWDLSWFGVSPLFEVGARELLEDFLVSFARDWHATH